MFERKYKLQRITIITVFNNLKINTMKKETRKETIERILNSGGNVKSYPFILTKEEVKYIYEKTK